VATRQPSCRLPRCLPLADDTRWDAAGRYSHDN
jgi:hypothetical protein